MARITFGGGISKWEDMVRRHQTAPHHGAAFLTWHSDFIVEFYELLKTVPEDDRPEPGQVKAWTKIPEELKVEEAFTVRINGSSIMGQWTQEYQDTETRLTDDIDGINSLEELANQINGKGLHGFLHLAVRHVHRDQDIYPAENAPRSTYFWQLHGLIEIWHLNWRRALIS